MASSTFGALPPLLFLAVCLVMAIAVLKIIYKFLPATHPPPRAGEKSRYSTGETMDSGPEAKRQAEASHRNKECRKKRAGSGLRLNLET
jgi:hypothetical protein